MGYYVSCWIDWYIWTVLPLLGSTCKNRYIYVHVHGWMDGWIDGWMDGWMDGEQMFSNRGYPYGLY